MEKKIKSLKELTQQIDALSQEYSMDDFAKSFKRRLSRMKIRFWESMADNKGLVNPVHAILTAKNSLSDEQMMKVLRVMEDLKEKYKYDEYMEKCDKLREQFLSDRSDYFASKMGKPLTLENEGKMSEILHDMLGVSDVVLCNWMDSILARIKPEVLSVDYEDLDGNIKNANIRAEPVRVTMEYISAPLIDRYTGSSQFDSFLLRSFFDADEKEWIYIPVRFIISVKSANTQINSETL
jgi:hypothetical protein